LPCWQPAARRLPHPLPNRLRSPNPPQWHRRRRPSFLRPRIRNRQSRPHGHPRRSPSLPSLNFPGGPIRRRPRRPNP
jgi:hypothetical protein